MARRLDYSARYTYTTKQVYAALSTESYWRERLATVGGDNAAIDTLEIDDSGISVVLKQFIPRTDLPAIAQPVIKKDMVITRKEHFGPFEETTAGEFTASIPGGPGSLGGTYRLFETPTGCTLRISTEAKVYLPFIGLKLEQMMLVNLVELFRAEAEFTADWLAKQ